jgi:hypothetical protein
MRVLVAFGNSLLKEIAAFGKFTESASIFMEACLNFLKHFFKNFKQPDTETTDVILEI